MQPISRILVSLPFLISFKISLSLFLLLAGTMNQGLAQRSESTQPASPLLRSFANHKELKRESSFQLEWINVSPVVNSARVEAVQLDPTRPGTLFAAFGSGGLWKSSNGGLNWTPKFENQPTHGIGDFALAPSKPDTIYLGTGESLKKARNFTIPGTGIYRSDNAGESWRHLGLDDTWHISEIAVHPSNPDIVLVAALGHFWSDNPNRGLFRTTDGGKSWQHVLFVNEQTGGNDVVWSRTNPNIVYASLWQHAPDVAGPASGVYRSTDAGATWEHCKTLPTGPATGRIGLAVSHQNADKVYALVDDRARIKQGGAAVVYRVERRRKKTGGAPTRTT